MTEHSIVNPESLGKPRGYSNGVLAAPGRMLFIAGQIGWGADQKLVSSAFAPQFEQALANLLVVVKEAGGKPEDVCRMTIYVVDREEYVAAAVPMGVAFRKLMGKHYPAMSLVVVKALLENGARVEIEATAVIP